MKKTLLIGIFVAALLLTVLNVHVIAKDTKDINQRTLNKNRGMIIDSNHRRYEHLGNSYNSWNRELDRVYLSLMKRLKPEGKKALEKTQIKWLEYKEEKEKNIWIIFEANGGGRGIIESLTVENLLFETVKQRTVELTKMLTVIKF